MKLWTLVCLLALSLACGGPAYSPAGPASVMPPLPPAQMSGWWSGRLTARAETATLSGGVVVRLEHEGTTVTGWWSHGGGVAGGEIQGTAVVNGRTVTMVGTITWDGEAETGPARCTGRAAVTGTVDDQGVLTLTAPTIPLAGCQAVTDVRMQAALIRG